LGHFMRGYLVRLLARRCSMLCLSVTRFSVPRHLMRMTARVAVVMGKHWQSQMKRP
jgi:hypothetical protein